MTNDKLQTPLQYAKFFGESRQEIIDILENRIAQLDEQNDLSGVDWEVEGPVHHHRSKKKKKTKKKKKVMSVVVPPQVEVTENIETDKASSVSSEEEALVDEWQTAVRRRGSSQNTVVAKDSSELKVDVMVQTNGMMPPMEACVHQKQFEMMSPMIHELDIPVSSFLSADLDEMSMAQLDVLVELHTRAILRAQDMKIEIVKKLEKTRTQEQIALDREISQLRLEV